MTKLQAYERALTLFGKIFSELENREDRYFLATIKFDFVFFLFALIHGRENEMARRGMRFFPRNFNEWQFGHMFILSNDDSDKFWDIDKEYFSQGGVVKRSGGKIAILTRGLDLDRFSDLEELIEKDKVGAVINWKSKKKWRVFGSISFFYFFFQNVFALFKIYRILTENCQNNLSLHEFLRYFIYYAFHSARIRYFIKILSRNNSIGKVIFSDIDNAWGNSFMLWSRFYGFSQIVYTHGSSLYFNKHRYFEPEIYFVYTAYHKKMIKDAGISSKVTISLPGWLKKSPSVRGMIKDEVHNIAFITGMEKNIEVPFGDKKMLLDYLEDLSRFIRSKNISLMIKSHKLLDWHKEYDGLSERFQCVKHVKERWNQRDIGQIDLGVLAVTESTLALQLLYMGIPVVTCLELMPEIWTKHFSAPQLQFVVKTKTELLELIKRFLSDREFYQRSQREAISIFNSIINKN